MLTKHWWNIGQAGYEDSKRWWWWSSDFSGKIINPSLHICHHSVCDPDPNPCRWTWPLLILATRIPIQIMTNPTLSSWSIILILILTDEADQPRLVGWQRCQLPCHPHSTHWTDTHWWLSTQFSPSSKHCHPEHPASVCPITPRALSILSWQVPCLGSYHHSLWWPEYGTGWCQSWRYHCSVFRWATYSPVKTHLEANFGQCLCQTRRHPEMLLRWWQR